MTDTTYKVGIYLRLSREDERLGESGSISTQRDLLLNYIRDNNLFFVDEYIDDGVSGTTFDREGFNRMIKDCEAKKINMIITKDNKILLQKRKGSKLWPDYYALPAGHIDEGETQFDALIREAQEELGIIIDHKKILNSYVVLRRNYFKIDGKQLEPYIDYYFEIKDYDGKPKIMEEEKCDELIWADINNLPEPFINYEGAFLEDKTITTYDCKTDGAYVKKLKK